MAIGLLGAIRGSGGVNTVVYTVPAGISHAVVHITLQSSAANQVFIRQASTVIDVEILEPNNGGSSGSTSVSMMLSPGDSVLVGSGARCTVSGYEVA
jgi:hypothetical protein